ncbi:Conjugative transposon protein TcpC [Seinonella peptonophila]|uniref:Conjugative transposon protein TcpC n=1 Tax=Seinonella peptonophila TaxID=112248 RepID=A0A1M4WMC1_9BACL|nr:conjugal transfer protein [Seinonella peptonophila]SHE82203.1 Conjugative transposon protein TcpC [Seinonella peptonophila]
MIQTTTKQKFWRWIFWGALLYTALTSTIAIGIQFHLIPVPARQTLTTQTSTSTSQNTNLGEVAFAKQFTREYLSWSRGNEGSRAIRLKPYWADSIDVQGGMDFSKLKWDSYPENVEVWKVTDRPGGEGIKEMTLFAETELINSDDSQQRKRVDRYLQIAIKKAGDSYRIVDKPTFIAPPVAKQVTFPDKKEDEGELVPSDVEQKVTSFLQSFWKAYTEDSPREISYQLKDQSAIAGLTGIVQFHELQNLKVTKVGETYKANCDVLLEDLASGVQINSHYRLELIEDKGQWFVTKLISGEDK